MQVTIDEDLASRLIVCREKLGAPSATWLVHQAVEALVAGCEARGYRLVVPFHYVPGDRPAPENLHREN